MVAVVAVFVAAVGVEHSGPVKPGAQPPAAGASSPMLASDAGLRQKPGLTGSPSAPLAEGLDVDDLEDVVVVVEVVVVAAVGRVVGAMIPLRSRRRPFETFMPEIE